MGKIIFDIIILIMWIGVSSILMRKSKGKKKNQNNKNVKNKNFNYKNIFNNLVNGDSEVKDLFKSFLKNKENDMNYENNDMSYENNESNGSYENDGGYESSKESNMESNKFMVTDSIKVNKIIEISKKWRWILAILVVILCFAGAAIFGLANFITDCMWYSQLGFESVIWIQLGAKIGVWVLYAILMSAFGYLSAALAIKARPSNADGTYIRIKGNVIDLKQGISSKLALHVAGIFSLIVGAVFGFKFYNHWAQILLMFNAQPFGIKDPQFGIDNGFYVFVLPGLRLFISAFVLLLVISLVFSIITHILMEQFVLVCLSMVKAY